MHKQQLQGELFQSLAILSTASAPFYYFPLISWWLWLKLTLPHLSEKVLHWRILCECSHAWSCPLWVLCSVVQKHRRRKEEERTRLLSIEFANMLTSTKSFFPSVIYSGKALCVVERRRSRCLGVTADIED